jgi:hypothetical protein
MLFPGAINWCVAFKPIVLTTPYAVGKSGDIENVHIYANHTANISLNYEYNPYTQYTITQDGLIAVTNPTEEYKIETQKEQNPWFNHDGKTYDAVATPNVLHEYQLHTAHDAFSAWRNVATALHVQVINTTDSNEGWFRAIRLPRERQQKQFFDIIMGPGSMYGNGNHIMGTPHFHTGGLIPSGDFLKNIKTKFQNNPTFCCGELQDIHNAVFQLNEVKERNEFTPLKTEVVYTKLRRRQLYKRDDKLDDPNDMFAIFPQYDLREARTDTTPKARGHWASNQQTDMTGFLSDNKDIILLHIRGGSKTKILLHSVNNQEFLTPDNSQLSQYVTPCDYDKQGLQNYNRNRSDYHKYPFHYLTNLEATEKAVPGPYYMSEPFHYSG